MSQYKSWEDKIKPEDTEFLKAFPSGEKYFNSLSSKDIYRQKKLKNFKARNKNLGQVFEAMLAFHLLDEDYLKKNEENNRKVLLSKLSNELILELWDVLSLSLEITDYQHVNIKYFTAERKVKYKNVYMELKKNQEYISKVELLKVLKNDISQLNAEIEFIIKKQQIEINTGEADNYHTYDNFSQVSRNQENNKSYPFHDQFTNVCHNVDSIDAISINQFEKFVTDSNSYLGIQELSGGEKINKYQELKIKKTNEIKALDSKINKIFKELKSVKYENYEGEFLFQSLENHTGLSERIVSNIVIGANSDNKNYTNSVINFLYTLMNETLKRDLMSQASTLFASPYILLSEHFVKILDNVNILDSMLANHNNNNLFKICCDEKESLKGLNILWKALDNYQTNNIADIFDKIVENNINYSKSYNFLDCNSDVNDLLINILENYLAYKNEPMLNVAKKIILYREEVISFNIKNNQKTKTDIDLKYFIEILKLIENKYPEFKEKNSEFYLPSTQLILSDSVIFDIKSSVEVEIDIKSLIGLQNKQFEYVPFLTRDKFLNTFNKFWKATVFENEMMDDFVSKDYYITENEKLKLFVKTIPSYNMNNNQLNNWTNKLLSNFLINNDWRNLKEANNIGYKIEELSQKELLEVSGIRAINKSPVKKF